MVIDLRKYNYIKPLIKALLERHKDRDLLNTIDNWAISNHIPIIVVSHYVAKEIGMTDRLIGHIKTMDDFYHYDQILGIDEI